MLIKAAGRPWQSQAAQWQDWPASLTLVVPTPPAARDAIGRRLGDVLLQGIEHHCHRREQAGRWRLGGHRRGGRAQPDGTTLLLASTSPLTIYPHLAKTNYDPLKDLTPLASVAVAPVAIVATKALPVKDFAA